VAALLVRPPTSILAHSAAIEAAWPSQRSKSASAREV
jgi:hypothetical protein